MTKITPTLPNPALAHSHTMRNRAEIARSATCGCGHCQRIFTPADITDWWDAPPGTSEALSNALGETAVCPFCGIDAVLGSACGYPIEEKFLLSLKKYCF